MFKDGFKYYKSNNPPPEFEEVLDFNKYTQLEENYVITRLNVIKPCMLLPQQYGLRKPEEWEVYEINSCKGLIFIKNPFTCAAQRYWIKKSLKDYSRKPNKLNIDRFNIIPNDKEWWDVAQIDNKVLKSLRWATMGYHHNWDTKVYSEDNKSDFPDDLKLLTEYIAQILGFMNFVAEAAIVNYYHLDSTLSGHTDHAEQNLEAPLFSFSFGQTAVFLIGGKTIDEKPTPIFLRSGDILIMSKYSRLCYHGVPKVIKTKFEVWNNKDELHSNYENLTEKDSCWTLCNNYLSYSRINMNVRQVLNSGQIVLY